MTTTSGVAKLPIHDPTTAPDGAKQLLGVVEGKYGFTPTLYKLFAGAPAAIKTYLEVAENFASTSLTNQEQQTVLLAAAAENSCHYCVAAHTWTSKGAKIADADIEAVRTGQTPSDPKLAAIARLTRHLVRERGFGSAEELDAFYAAGFASRHVLEVLVGITLKTLSNYTNHLGDTPLDPQLAPFAP